MQLCKQVTVLPKGQDWVYELKYDGYRILAVHGRLISRNGNDWTDKFKSIKAPPNMILDGEVVANRFLDIRKSLNLVYVVFDILELDGEDLRSKPLLERKEVLRRVLPANLQYSDFKTSFTQSDYDALCNGGFEGIIAKRKNSVYSGTRNGAWVKLKCRPHAITSQITNPDKFLFENITKVQVAEYYQKVASRMLHHIKDRYLALVKCPKGIDNDCFYNKNQNEKLITVSSSEELLTHVQMNTIEFHTWCSTIHDLEKPDLMVFDLDPDEGMELGQVRQGVRDLKSILDELNLKSFLKTSGGKGYHVVVPFKAEWKNFRLVAKNVADVMEAKWSDRYTTNIRKQNRKGKIFIDWLRNTRGATSVAPYSVRAKKGAPISMPIEWNELNEITPSDIDIRKAIGRLKRPDPWTALY